MGCQKPLTHFIKIPLNSKRLSGLECQGDFEPIRDAKWQKHGVGHFCNECKEKRDKTKKYGTAWEE